MRSSCARTSSGTWRWGKTTSSRGEGHGRDRPRRRGDDVLHRRRVRPDCVHGRHRGPVVPAVRAHHRVVGARVTLHLVLARPDAFGVLARPAQTGAPQSVDHASARSLQSLVRSACATATSKCHRVGARPPLVDGGIAIGSLVVAIGAAGRCRRLRLHADRRIAASHDRCGCTSRLEPAIHDTACRACGRASLVRIQRSSTRTRPSATRPPRPIRRRST